MNIEWWIKRLQRLLTLAPAGEEKEAEFVQMQMLEEAHQELMQAENLFSRVEDPDMIDYAIYSMKAAEERYDFLIKLIKASWAEGAPFQNTM